MQDINLSKSPTGKEWVVTTSTVALNNKRTITINYHQRAPDRAV